MKPLNPEVRKLGEQCAWCSKDLSQPLMLLAKLPPGYPIKKDSVLLPVELTKRKKISHAVVMQPGSPGKLQGYDVMFGLCSQKCVDELKKAIEEEGVGFELRN